MQISRPSLVVSRIRRSPKRVSSDDSTRRVTGVAVVVRFGALGHRDRVRVGQDQAEAFGALREAAQVAAAVEQVVDELAARGILLADGESLGPLVPLGERVHGLGDGSQQVVGAISLGKSVDGFVQHSQTAQTLAGPWLDGSASFTDNLTKVLGSTTTADVQNLTVSALLMKLMPSGSGQLNQLLPLACQLGLADMPVSELVGRGGVAGPPPRSTARR